MGWPAAEMALLHTHTAGLASFHKPLLRPYEPGGLGLPPIIFSCRYTDVPLGSVIGESRPRASAPNCKDMTNEHAIRQTTSLSQESNGQTYHEWH